MARGGEKYRWVKLNETYILFALKTEHVLPEWQPVAQVTRRQVYERQEPQWYVWIYEENQMVELGHLRSENAALATAHVEDLYVGARRATTTVVAT